jgi:hypothetical protein
MLDLVISAVGLAIPLGILLPFRLAYCALFKWSGGWRIAGILPLLVLVAFFAPLKADWSRDPASDNLWGLIFIPIGLLVCVYSLVLLLMHRHHLKRSV